MARGLSGLTDGEAAVAIGTPTVGTYTEWTSGTSQNIPFPSSVNLNDLLLLMVDVSSATLNTVPVGWTSVASFSRNGSAAAPNILVAIKYAGGTEGGTNQAITVPSAAGAGQILAFPGVDLTTPQDVAAQTVDTGTTNGTHTTFTPGPTVATAGAAIVYVAANQATAQTSTPPTGFTETGDRGSGTRDFTTAYALGFGTGSTGTIENTWSGSSTRIGVLITLRPAASLTPVTPATRATTWDTLAATTPATRATTWTTLAATTPAARATTWTTLAQASASRATTWATLAATTPSSRATTWTARAQVTPSTRATTWTTLGQVAATRATTWATRAQVTPSTRASTWAVLGAVTPATRATTWTTLAAVTASTRATQWAVASALAAVTPSTRATTWAVLGQVGATRATTWTTLAQVAATRGTTWAVLGQVTPSSRATTWTTRAQVAASTRATAWSTRAQAAASRATTWTTLAAVAPSTRATQWAVAPGNAVAGSMARGAAPTTGMGRRGASAPTMARTGATTTGMRR